MTLSLTHDLDLQSPVSYGPDLLHAKVQGQRSVGSEIRVETNGQMDRGDCITSHANVVGKNVLDQGRPTTLAWPVTFTLTFDPLQATVMTYSHAKIQGQWSVGSKDRVETNVWTDGANCITSHANAVGNYCYVSRV